MPTSLASIPSNKSPEVSQVHSARVRPKLKLQPLVRDIGLTIATELFVLVSILLVTSLMGRLLGASPLGEYLLVRRVVAWLYSGAQLGLGVALPRYVAYAVNSSDGKRESYFIAAFSLLLGTALCLGVVLFIGRPHVSQWLFGSAQLTRLMLPLWFLILGLLTHAAVYGYYRGCLLIARANAMQLSNSLLALITVLVLYRLHSLPLIVTTMGCCTVVNAGVFAVPIFSTIKAHTWPAGFINHAFELLRYGIGRVPGESADGRSGPPGAVTHCSGGHIRIYLLSAARICRYCDSCVGRSRVFRSNFGGAPSSTRYSALSTLCGPKKQHRRGQC